MWKKISRLIEEKHTAVVFRVCGRVAVCLSQLIVLHLHFLEAENIQINKHNVSLIIKSS